MAKKPPIATIQSGIEGGRFKASKSPVKTAEKSLTVIFFFMKRSYAYSARTHEATDVKITRAAFIPKKYIPHIAAGIRAMITSSIMVEIDSSVCI